MWEFAFNFRKTRTSRRPDLRLDDKEKEILGICDMVYPQENNIVTRRDVKQKNYSQVASELGEQRAV